MSPRELQRIVRDVAGKSDEAVDLELNEARLDAQDRISIKVELQAQRQQRTMAAHLATDSAEWKPSDRPLQPLTEIERLMQRAGLQPGMKYTEADIEQGCKQAGIVEPSDKLAVKLEAEVRQMLLKRSQPAQERRLYGKSMQASAERSGGKRLTGQNGRPLTLRSIPD
jgi:hypothetical protein